jgi:hypothetical protein
MGSVEYSEYPFSYQPTKTDKNEQNEKKEIPVIEGIANFCDLNRSYANQYRQGWNNLTNAISNSTSQKTGASAAKKTNTLLQTTTGTTALTRYPYTCGDIRGKIFKQDGITVSPNGTIYAYSTDLKIQRGSTSVNANGEFNGLNVKLINATEKFVFTYEDVTGKTWSLDIKSGSGTSGRASCSDNNKYYALKIVRRKSFGDSVSQARDPNGKLINTELKNSGAELRYNGMKAIYAETITNTMNLGIGVLAAIVFIAKNQ